MNTVVNYAKTVASLTWMQTFAAKGEFKDLKEKTAMVIPGALSGDVCKSLISRIEELADMPDHPRVWRDKVGSDTRIFGFEQDIGDLQTNFKVERYIKAVDDYTGRTTKSWFLMANRVVPKQNNLGSGGGIHRDSPFSHQVKCIWYLNDVTTENGPFCYVPGTHFNVLQTRRDYPLGASRFDKIKDGDTLVEVHASAGALLVCDTKCIHAGKPIETGARYAVTLYTLPTENGAKEIFAKSGIDPIHVRHSVV